ncbi:MAG TPA: DUF4340 domain-containing protein [Anaerolineales bacterium]|nr:DUF4340 domain-containing protein [Anaerolineales bacterium]
MIRPATVVYIVLLLVLVGAYYYLNNRAQPVDIELTAEPGTETAPTYLFTAEEGTPTSIRIEAKSGETVEVARGEDSAWALTQPEEAKADQASAEAAASQVTTMRILETVPDVDPGIVGLEDPEYVLNLKFTSGGERTVDVGVITPSESGYYVRDGDRVVIVSRSAIDALLGLLTNPPYLETPTSEAGAGTLLSETATLQP